MDVIFERARFHMKTQDELAEQYVIALHSLAENCEYGTMAEKLIRDRLVIGIKDASHPSEDKLQGIMKPSWMVRNQITLHKDLLLF